MSIAGDDSEKCDGIIASREVLLCQQLLCKAQENPFPLRRHSYRICTGGGLPACVIHEFQEENCGESAAFKRYRGVSPLKIGGKKLPPALLSEGSQNRKEKKEHASFSLGVKIRQRLLFGWEIPVRDKDRKKRGYSSKSRRTVCGSLDQSYHSDKGEGSLEVGLKISTHRLQFSRPSQIACWCTKRILSLVGLIKTWEEASYWSLRTRRCETENSLASRVVVSMYSASDAALW